MSSKYSLSRDPWGTGAGAPAGGAVATGRRWCCSGWQWYRVEVESSDDEVQEERRESEKVQFQVVRC